METFQNIVILTGAGLSAESGLSTFRDPNGIWAKYDYRDVATPEGFARNPGLVYEFYNMRLGAHADVKPNAAHHALALLEREHGGSVAIVTQNVDALHEAAGARNVIHMHGEVLNELCAGCGDQRRAARTFSAEHACAACGVKGLLRPDIVWFGEMPYHLDRIAKLLADADLFISIGTSGNVYPAAGFVAEAARQGAHTVELNLEPSEGASFFAEAIHGRATEVVPRYVERLLARQA